MGLKIWCQVGELEFFLQNYPMYVFFWKIMLKVWISGGNGPLIFFILCGYIDKLYTYLYMLQKIVTNILMGFKILCQVEDLESFFKITLCTCVFEKSCLPYIVYFWKSYSHSPTLYQIATVSLRGPGQIYTTRPKAEFDGTGWTDGTVPKSVL